MSPFVYQKQIVRTVVRFYSVQMVHLFPWQQLTSQHPLHHLLVLIRVLARLRSSHSHIAICIQHRATQKGRIIAPAPDPRLSKILIETFSAASFFALQLRRRYLQAVTACHTLSHNHHITVVKIR